VLDTGGAAGGGRPASSRLLLAEALPQLPLAAESDRPLLAIDLGCRNGLDSLELMRRGWTVLAITDTPRTKRLLLAEVPHGQAEVPHGQSARLTIEVGNFRALVLPPADLIYSGATLSCRPSYAFGPVWSRIVPAVRPSGWFVGQFLGDRGPRSLNPDLTCLTRKKVITLLSGFRIELLRERELSDDHSFDVIARRRPVRSAT